MSKQINMIVEGKNFRAADMGHWSEIAQYVTGPFQGKVFLKEALKMSGSEISFGALPADTALPFFHAHKQNEEVYVVLQGEGKMQLDGTVFDLKEGSIVRVDPAAVRSLKSGSKGLMFMVIQTAANSLKQWTGDDGIIVEEKWTK